MSLPNHAAVFPQRVCSTMFALAAIPLAAAWCATEPPAGPAVVSGVVPRLLADLRKELGLPADAKPHFKGAWTHHGRVVIANNTFTEADARGEASAG